MAHELDQSTGRTAFASVRKPAWHGLGQILPDFVDAKSMLELAGLDWEVRFGPVFDADMTKIEGYNRTYRSDTNKTLGVVGSRYRIAQNETLVKAAEDFSKAGKDYGINFGLETAGALYEGKRVFVTATFDKSIYVGGDEITTNLVITTSHDGSTATRVFLSPIRVVCQNTLGFALRGAKRIFSVTHTASADLKIQQIEAELGMMREYYEGFEAKANELLEKAFSKSQFEDLVKKLVPIDDFTSKRSATIGEDVRTELMNCRAAADLDSIRDTAWGAFNAVADYADHRAVARGKDKESRAFERTFEDSVIKDRAFELIMAR